MQQGPWPSPLQGSGPFATMLVRIAMTIPAKYENGVFKPLSNVRLKEGTIVDVYVPSEPKPEKRRRSVREFGFVGMWADRDDIEDGVSYVNRLRDNPRGTSGSSAS